MYQVSSPNRRTCTFWEKLNQLMLPCLAFLLFPWAPVPLLGGVCFFGGFHRLRQSRSLRKAISGQKIGFAARACKRMPIRRNMVSQGILLQSFSYLVNPSRSFLDHIRRWPMFACININTDSWLVDIECAIPFFSRTRVLISFDWCDFQELSMPDGKHLLRRTGSFLKLKDLQAFQCALYTGAVQLDTILLESNSERIGEGHARFHAVPKKLQQEAVSCSLQSEIPVSIPCMGFKLQVPVLEASKGGTFLQLDFKSRAMHFRIFRLYIDHDQLRTEYRTYSLSRWSVVLEIVKIFNMSWGIMWPV